VRACERSSPTKITVLSTIIVNLKSVDKEGEVKEREAAANHAIPREKGTQKKLAPTKRFLSS